MIAMQSRPEHFLIAIGMLAEILEVKTPKVIAAAQEMGIDHFDYQINCVGYVHATHAAMIIRRLAVSEGHCDFPGHPVLLAEVQRLAAEQSARSDA